jgi:uncharacterized membrane protein YdjX (TVP38/TMEM64 family)
MLAQLGRKSANQWMQHKLLQILQWIAGHEDALILFVLVYIAATIAAIPGSPLTLASAILFGFWKGLLAVFVGANIGACLAFLCARYLARDWVARKLKGRSGLQNFDAALKQSGWRVVLLLRLAPLFPFNVLNYALGLSAISFRHYLAGTVVGMIPGTIVYVYVGSLIGDLARLGTERTERTPLEWGMSAVGLIAAVAATFYLVRLAKKQLGEPNGRATQNQPR